MTNKTETKQSTKDKSANMTTYVAFTIMQSSRHVQSEAIFTCKITQPIRCLDSNKLFCRVAYRSIPCIHYMEMCKIEHLRYIYTTDK